MVGNLNYQQKKKPQKLPSKKGKEKEENVTRDAEELPIWTWTSLSDPSSSRIPPIFTRDGNFFFSFVGSSVKIHSAMTGLVASTLSAPPSDVGLSNVLTSAILNPQNSLQLIAATLDGRILIWDFVNATLLQTINVGQHIHLICAHENFKGFVFVAASAPRRKETDNNAVVLRISLRQQNPSGKPSDIIFVGKTRFPTGLAISSSGTWLVASAAHKVYIAKTSDLEAGFTKYVSPEHLTCLSFHPFEDYFATGDTKGVVRLWYCLNDELAVNVRDVEKKTQTRPLHWHAHSVSSLAFSANGAYLLSGGEEAVLVIWQIQTGKKEFVPRIGAPISTISVTKSLRSGEEEFLLGLTDATFVFVGSASLKISKSFSQLKINPRDSSSTMDVPLAFHHPTMTWILPSSHPSSLQIYSLSSSSLLSELEISPSNRVSRKDEKPLIPSRVEKITMSSTGSWMATVDSRTGDVDFRPEVYLKFWSWVGTSGWTVNTRIDRPHGVHRVTDISFSPCVRPDASPMLVSTGEDGHIKVWHLQSPPGSETSIWSPYATLSFRSETPSSVSWSSDSSLFAVAVGPHVALYDPFTRSMRQTLTAPGCPKIHFVHFINGLPGHLLASSSMSILMWDLIDSCVTWQCALSHQLEKVVLHPREALFAVFHSVAKEGSNTRVSIFGASSTSPSAVYALPFQVRNVAYDPSQATTGFNLVGITLDWRTVLIGDFVPHFNDESRLARKINLDDRPENRTLFENIFGPTAFMDDLPAYDHSNTTPSSSVSQRKMGHSMFDTPAFATPPLDTMFDPLITTLLSVRQSNEVAQEIVSEDVNAMDMDSQGGILTATRRPSRGLNPGELEAFTKFFRTSCVAQGLEYKFYPMVDGSELTRYTRPDSATTPVGIVNGKANKPPKRTEVGGLRALPAVMPKRAHPQYAEEDDDTCLPLLATSVPNTISNKKRKRGQS